ncbi:MAG: 16S rRNA (cytosine(1402)-N(4))-methyltransferase RsmH [Eubacteriales bacterium]|nr:16S rRNA (cytosine(1402)-N(4))-methyltransferase RsmH [Eubacteriales bacterium]
MGFEHTPVLLKECIEHLRIKADGTYIDGTSGGGGHSAEIYKQLSEKGFLLSIDRDPEAVSATEQHLRSTESRAQHLARQGNFIEIEEICEDIGLSKADGILLDLGVSSHQLEDKKRGFSYMWDSPIDMRMDTGSSLSASEIVNNYTQEEIRNIIRNYGEEKWASRIAGFIVEARQKKEITTTGQLVEIIKAAIPASARRQGPHPAKRTFQALRIAVNDELNALEAVIEKGVDLLSEGGRICIITFHSLEDRIVKTKFKQLADPCVCPEEFPVCVCGKRPKGRIITKKPQIASETEIESNPRARSAKLRVLERI